MASGGDVLILTCEHAAGTVPAAYRKFFPKGILNTHRAVDFGARETARVLARRLGAPLFCGRVSRLVVDLNRSAANPGELFNRYMEEAGLRARQNALRRYHGPYRRAVTARIRAAIKKGRRVIHVSVHSFTPVRKGRTRRADVGLLFDPARAREKVFCSLWRRALRRTHKWHVRFNYPYRGTSDGLTTALRRAWPAGRYLGIELEMNQLYPLRQPRRWAALKRDLIKSLKSTLTLTA